MPRYDELCFGKPHADFYVDAAAVSAFSELHKELGIYAAAKPASSRAAATKPEPSRPVGPTGALSLIPWGAVGVAALAGAAAGAALAARVLKPK